MIRILSAEKEVTLAMALVARVYREFDLQEGDTEGEKIMQEYAAPASVLKKIGSGPAMWACSLWIRTFTAGALPGG